MKKVRFQSPNKSFRPTMDENECQSPRPFIDRHETCRPDLAYDYPKILPYNPDPVQRYECSNSSPYPMVAKTSIRAASDSGTRWPSNDLELSMLDSSFCEPRQPIQLQHQKFYKGPLENVIRQDTDKTLNITPRTASPSVLQSIENTNLVRPMPKNIGDQNFFIMRDNLHKMYPSGHINSIQSQLNRLSIDKDNSPLAKKSELIQTANTEPNIIKQKILHEPVIEAFTIPDECRCHHCVKIIQNDQCGLQRQINLTNPRSCPIEHNFPKLEQHCCMPAKQQHTCHCTHCLPIKPTTNTCGCQKTNEISDASKKATPKNCVDKKAWMVEKYAQNNNHDGMEVEKQNSVTKDKREPTVSDLFKIIKLQNEQLQLLQEKVDKFISASTSKTVSTPVHNYMTEHVAVETVDSEQHKISIGVMTSFEMVRTSTVINKEIVTQTNDNAQIQCNRSQISIKEVVSKQPATMNFLDGISPASKASGYTDNAAQSNNFCATMQQTDNNFDDKTLNELSLYNVHVDNVTTPLLSPEQSLYLDVRDYSDSDSNGEDQSNVGWTYYNKVMTHVNGVLQDSEMPSSASALFRNTKQQCVQMQIDKTNVSVTKRVKFGDDPLGLHQPHLYTAATDTSLKMNQLAAKYLKGAALPPPPVPTPAHKAQTVPIEMSFATRNYMERHRILQGNAFASRAPPAGEIPRFLDITALKQQTKLL